MRSAPEAYHSTIIHYAEPRFGLEEILRSVDVVFNVCYGYREKSQADVAGWLDGLGLCHTSPTQAAQDLAQDKASYPELCARAGVPTPQLLEREELNSIDGLVIAKPRFGGCHKGVEIDLGPALAAKLNATVEHIFQRYLDGREFSVAVIPDKECRSTMALPPLEVVPDPPRQIYIAGQTFGRTMIDFEPEIPTKLEERLRDIALRLHNAFPLSAYSRVDIRATPDGQLFALDVNAMPNVSPNLSFLPRCCEHHGISLGEFVRRVVEYSRNSYAGDLIAAVDTRLDEELIRSSAPTLRRA